MGLEWLALVSALLWASGSLLSVVPARHLGTFSFSRWRMVFVSLFLGAMTLWNHGWQTLSWSQFSLMGLSGFIGIFIGDTCLYACLNRMGPRRSSLLFATHSAFTAFFGVWLFQEKISAQGWLGVLAVFSGVMIAVSCNHKSTQKLEAIHGPWAIALILGILSALCQSLGTIIAKPVMSAGVDPVAGSLVRMGVALAAHLVIWVAGVPACHDRNPINRRVVGIIVLNGFLAMTLGMTIFLYALSHGDVTLVAILSSTSPVMLLPLLWMFTRQRPSLPAWGGALLVVMGTALILGR